MENNNVGYRGKHFTLPSLSQEGVEIIADHSKNLIEICDNPILEDLNSVWDLKKFMNPRIPVSLGFLNEHEQSIFSQKGVPRTLDMPIKFPGSNFRIPKTLEQFRGVIEKVAHFEAAINEDCFDEYYCYMTVDQDL